ncbi:hypothetical protein [Pseudoflavonifractor sp. 60]|uniref:hypothetical protein n=1 Tax=Pseudoflavonifractor sp. 60 TaxID=2304576 RepID=UPI00136FF055|nr:hypothetical protein [Pseudoflavonifractor sp. 60]
MVQKIKQVKELSIGENLQRLRKNVGLSQEDAVAQLQLAGLDIVKTVEKRYGNE